MCRYESICCAHCGIALITGCTQTCPMYQANSNEQTVRCVPFHLSTFDGRICNNCYNSAPPAQENSDRAPQVLGGQHDETLNIAWK